MEDAVDHKEKGTLPDYASDPAVCLKCWAFKRLCAPPFFATGAGLKVIEDSELEAKLDLLAELKPQASSYAKLDKEVKELFKEQDGLVVGKWLVTGETATRSMKAQPAKEAQTITYWKTTVEKIETGATQE